ncbi:MAG: dTDP-4-dehydrorhamnose reductase [Acidimicrobiia bacterium]
MDGVGRGREVDVRTLVTGAGGQVGQAVGAALGSRELVAVTHADLDLADRDRVEQALDEIAPDAVINCGALTDVDRCEHDVDAAFAANALGVRNLAAAATRVGAHVVHISTDYVFDGRSTTPYDEWAPVAPLSEYGRSKLAGERELARHASSWTVVRAAWVFGRRGGDFVSWVLAAVGRGETPPVVDDQRSSPTYAPDLAATLVALAAARRPGIFHVTNAETATRLELATAALSCRGLDPGSVKPVSFADLDRPAARPTYSVLDNRALRIAGLPALRSWRDALAEYLGGAQ